MLKRSTFKRPKIERKPAVHRVLAKAPNGAKIVSVPVVRPKENVITSQAYRREVRKLPCIRCGVVGFTQFCHSDEGKGIGIKTDDRRGWPGCGPHFVGLKLVSGCHYDIGTSGFLTRAQRRSLEEDYARRTRATIIADGNWPEGLPMWPQDQLA